MFDNPDDRSRKFLINLHQAHFLKLKRKTKDKDNCVMREACREVDYWI